MLKRFLKNLSHSFCIYLLAVMNLIHAVTEREFDWLLIASLLLSALSVILNLVAAVKGGEMDA